MAKSKQSKAKQAKQLRTSGKRRYNNVGKTADRKKRSLFNNFKLRFGLE